jgi:hypothetical protein
MTSPGRKRRKLRSRGVPQLGHRTFSVDCALVLVIEGQVVVQVANRRGVSSPLTNPHVRDAMGAEISDE